MYILRQKEYGVIERAVALAKKQAISRAAGKEGILKAQWNAFKYTNPNKPLTGLEKMRAEWKASRAAGKGRLGL